MFEKVVDSIDKITDYFLYFIFLLLIFFGLYTMCDTYLIYDAAKGEDLKMFRPNIVEAEEFVWDIDALSEDVVAWLTIYDTTIDYPVLQGSDNLEYLDKDPFGNYSLSGSIFLDSRNSSNFLDDYSLIYGHHMEQGYMFGALDSFKDETYFKEHKYGEMIVGNKLYKLELFAFLYADGSNKEIFAPTEINVNTVLTFIKNRAIIWTNHKDGKIVAFSTCKFPTTTERTILVGVLYE